MFQSKVGTFKFKSNPSLVYTQSFLKVLGFVFTLKDLFMH